MDLAARRLVSLAVSAVVSAGTAGLIGAEDAIAHLNPLIDNRRPTFLEQSPG